MKCNKTQSKWCINKHGASKIIDTFETYHPSIKPTEPVWSDQTTAHPHLSLPLSRDAMATTLLPPLAASLWPSPTNRHHQHTPHPRLDHLGK
jgi:hypothetical protein